MRTTLVPLPGQLEERAGAFRLEPDAAIGFEGPDSAREIAELLADYLRPATGFALPVRAGAGAIAQRAPDPAPDDAGFLPEGYALDVAPGGVRLEAATSWGLARGVQTLRQLFPAEVYAAEARPGLAWEAPAVRIEDARRVLGGQGQLWTEYIATRDRLDYMAYPRASALAEVLWTPPGRRRYADFLERLAAHRARFRVQGVNARPRP